MDTRRANPYRPEPGSEPPALVGRENEQGTVRIMLDSAREGGPLRPLVFIGQRGMGKTALLRRCIAIAQESEAVVLSVEASPDRSLTAAMSRGLADAKRSIATFPERVRGAIEALRKVLPAPSYDLPHDMGKIALSPSNSEKQLVLHEKLDELNEAVRRSGRYLVITIDEIQESRVDDLRELVMFVHAAAGTDTPVVFLGAGLTNSAAHLHAARTYTERWRYPRLGYLSPQETMDAVALPAEKLGVTFTPEALECLVEETAGYPFFIQEYAAVVWARSRGARITREEVETLCPDIRKELEEQFYAPRFARLTYRECAYALALADLGEGAHPVHEVAQAFNVLSKDVSSIRNQLLKKDVVFSPSSGMIEFRMPLSVRYVQRHREQLERRASGAEIGKPKAT